MAKAKATHSPVTHGDHIHMVDKMVTHHAIADGGWSVPGTWQEGKVPDVTSCVKINPGITVSIGGNFSADCVSIAGSLIFDRLMDSAFMCDTLIVEATGKLDIGTPTNPVSGRVLLSFNATPVGDWEQLGHGLHSMGKVSIWGQKKTTWARVTANPKMGATEITLATVPIGWKVGDNIVIPGVAPAKRLQARDAELPDPDPVFREQHEVRKITVITGTKITFDKPLAYDTHWQVMDDVKICVGNLNHNIVVMSVGPNEIPSRGHIMLMGGPNMIGYCTLKDLGRSRADIHISDPRKDAAGTVIPESVSNIRGRYSLHFHKIDPKISHIVQGVSVWGGKKWGITNHGSNVEVTDCFSFDVDGAHFATENGVEFGCFKNCLAVRARGPGRGTIRQFGFSGEDLMGRVKEFAALYAPVGKDWGIWGYGFWMQSPMITVEDNVAFGCNREAFAWTSAPMGTDWQNLPAQFPLETLPAAYQVLLNKDKFGKLRTRVPIDVVPVHAKRNQAFGCAEGLGVYFIEARAAGGSSMKDSQLYNCGVPFYVYSPNDGWLFENCKAKFHPDLITTYLPNAGNIHYSGTRNVTFKNVQVVNYAQGINPPNHGRTILEGPDSLYVTKVGVGIEDGDEEIEYVDVNLSPSQFKPIADDIIKRTHAKVAVQAGVKQYAIALRANDRGLPDNTEVTWQGKRVYYTATAPANAVAHPAISGGMIEP